MAKTRYFSAWVPDFGRLWTFDQAAPIGLADFSAVDAEAKHTAREYDCMEVVFERRGNSRPEPIAIWSRA